MDREQKLTRLLATLGIELMVVNVGRDIRCPHVKEPTAVTDYVENCERPQVSVTDVKLLPYWDRGGLIGAIGKCETCGKIYYYTFR